MASSCESEGYCLQPLLKSYLYTCHKPKDEVESKRVAGFLPHPASEQTSHSWNQILHSVEVIGYLRGFLQVPGNQH